MDLIDIIKNNNLPLDFNKKYNEYLDNPILWLIPLNPNIDKSIFDNKLMILVEINDILIYKNDIVNKDFFENLFFYPINNKLIIDIIFEKYKIYFDPFDKTVKVIDNLNDLTKLIQFIMNKILVDNEIILLTNNLSIENYYKNIYSFLINNKSNINSFKELINLNIKLPKYSKETAKIYYNVFKEKFNIPNIHLIPFCLIDAINNNSIDYIFNLKFNMNTINKIVKSNHHKKINKENMDIINDCYKHIKYFKFNKDEYDKLDDKEEFIKSACLIDNINYLINV